MNGGTWPFAPDKSMPIASAGKWMYSAYVLEARRGVLDPENDVRYLNFKSGYGKNGTCGVLQSDSTTVANCFNSNKPKFANLFDYDSGHMQGHANTKMELGSKTGDYSTYVYTIPVVGTLGPTIGVVVDPASSGRSLGYQSPVPAGGAYSAPDAYGRFLRNVLDGTLKYTLANLDTFQVTANPDKVHETWVNYSPLQNIYKVTLTPKTAINDAYPGIGVGTSYGFGHWVEDPNPAKVDGAFSSAGYFGFYPWIDRTKTWYGVVARAAAGTQTNASLDAIACGVLVRSAWATATPK